MGLQHKDSGSGVAGAAARRESTGGSSWGRWLPWFALLYILVAGLFLAWAKMETIQLTYEVQQLRTEQRDLRRTQQILDAEVASLQSPAYLTSRAVDLGLQDAPPGVVIRVE
jgi:cell division protein FtsL